MAAGAAMSTTSSTEVRTGLFRTLWILWGFRRKVMEGVMLDVRHRYAGSLLGLGWSLLFPVFQIAIYALVYVFIFRVRPAGIEQFQYILMVFSGLLPLMAFNEALSVGTSALVSKKELLTTTVFPAELIPVRAIVAAQTPSMLGFLVVSAFTLFAGYATPAAILLVPLFWIGLLMFVIGLAWVLSLLSLIVRDIQQVLPLVMMTLMILSPFAYTPDMVPSALKALLYANPLSYFVLSFQSLLTFGRLPEGLFAAVAFLLAIGSFLLGFVFFRRAKHLFFDYA
jgi:lipopolysaccharide transport system permease protein